MKKMDLEKVMQWLSYVLKCPVCGYKYNLDRTKVVGTKEEDSQAHLLVHSDCGQCKSSVVFSIAINGPDIFSVGVITDLTSGDTKKFSSIKPISSNEVLAMHDFLHRFDGDLIKILK